MTGTLLSNPAPASAFYVVDYREARNNPVPPCGGYKITTRDDIGRACYDTDGDAFHVDDLNPNGFSVGVYWYSGGNEGICIGVYPAKDLDAGLPDGPQWRNCTRFANLGRENVAFTWKLFECKREELNCRNSANWRSESIYFSART